MKASDYRRIVLLGLALEASLLAMIWLGDLRESIPEFLLMFFLAFSCYLATARNLSTHPQAGFNPLPLILGFAVLFRLTLLASEPSLSDDIYRYVWDGKIFNLGVNPYQFPPDARELAGFRDGLHDPINHKDIGTPYGPLAIMVFGIAQYSANSVQIMKLPFILFDGMILLLLLHMLRTYGISQTNIVHYAWNPLVLVEISGSGHNDSLAILLSLGALYLYQRNKTWPGTLVFAMAMASKYFAILLLPAVWSRMGKRAWIAFPLLLLLLYAPFHSGLGYHFESLVNVGSRWRFNDSLFSLLHSLTGSLQASKILAGALFAALAITIHHMRPDLLKGAMILIGAALLLTSTLQPWYLLWIVPFLCFYPNRAWILLTGLIMLSYHVLIRYSTDGIWAESQWIKAVIYLPFYGLLVADAWRSRQARRAQSPA